MAKVWWAMLDADWHTYLMLTKWPERLSEFIYGDHRRREKSTSHASYRNLLWAPHHIWLGVSVESKDQYNRIDELQRTPASKRWISLEPLLGPVPDLPLDGIDLVILGFESGAGARPGHPEWARSVRDQCKAAGVAFRFKQWGEWSPEPERGRQYNIDIDSDVHIIAKPYARAMYKRGKKAAGRLLDGVEYSEWPE